MSDPETLRVYDQRASDYADSFAITRADASLTSFLQALPPGARILDLGCGPGSWARLMVAAGFTVEAVDASQGMVTEARRDAPPGLTVRQARFDQIDGPARYDGIWANFSLLHAPRAEMPGHLARLRRALIPGGILHIGLKSGEGAARDALGRFYTFYTPDTLAPLLIEAGFAPGALRQGADKGLDGTVAPWFTQLCHG